MDASAEVDQYIDSQPEAIRATLREIRSTIHAAVPGSGETISYGMPTVTVGGRSLVHFGAWAHHIGLYPVPTVDRALAAELRPYQSTSNTLRFPLDEPVPLDLVERIVALLAEQKSQRAAGA